MAGNIKGITVEIGGDTSPLERALKDVNKQSRDLQSELREVERALKLDPGNVVLLDQKQKLLAGSIQVAKEKLDTLKEAERQVQEQFAAGKVSEEQYRALQREVIKAEQGLQRLESQASKLNVTLGKISAGAKHVADGAGDVAAKMTPATAAIAGLGAAAFNLGSDLIESANKVDVTFQDNAESVEAWSKSTLENYGIAAGTALDMAALFGDMGTAMGQSTDEAAQMSTGLVGLAGDLASFKNIGIAQAQDALKGIFTGEGESLKSLGIVMQDSTLEAYALASGQEKAYKEMTQAEKVALRYAFVMDATKNAQGDFARTGDGAANSVRVASESMKDAGASLGVVLAPVIAQVAQHVAGLARDFTGLDDGTKRIILTILALIAAVAPVAGIISGIATIVGGGVAAFTAISGAIGLMTGAVTVATPAATALAGAITFMTGPIGLVILAIGAVIAAGVLLYQHWDEVKAYAAQLWEWIAQVFENIRKVVSDSVESMKNFVRKNWVEITRLFYDPIGAVLTLLYNLNPQFKVWVDSAYATIKNTLSNWWELGQGMIDGIRDGVKRAAAGLADSVIGAARDALNAAKDFLGIQSPSRVFREQVGAMIGAGIALGISDSRDEVAAAMDYLNTDLQLGIGTGAYGIGLDGGGSTVTNNTPVTVNVYDGSNGMRRELTRLGVVL